MKRKINAPEQLTFNLHTIKSEQKKEDHLSAFDARASQIEGLRAQLFCFLPGSSEWSRLAPEYNLALNRYVQDFEHQFKEASSILRLPTKGALGFYRKAKLALETLEQGSSAEKRSLRLGEP